MIGDSTMNGLYVSLGCLMRRLSEGAISTWDVSEMTRVKDDYQSRNGPAFKQACRPPAQLLCPSRVTFRMGRVRMCSGTGLACCVDSAPA